MNVNVTLDKKTTDYSKIAELRDRADKALDLLWSGKEEKYKWVKLPINYDADVLDNLDKVGLLIGGRCGMIVMVGEQKTLNTARNIINALPEDGGFPTCLFVDETLSAKAMEKVLLQCRQNEIVVIGISEQSQSQATVANFKILENFVREKYGQDKIKSHIYFVIGAEPSAFREIAVEGEYSTITNTDIFFGEEGILSPTVLLPMAITGHNISDFVKGCEDMISDPAWDLNATDYAINLFLKEQEGKEAINVVYDAELKELARINGLTSMILPNDQRSLEAREGKAYLTLLEAEENDVDVLLPNSKHYTAQSLREMMNEIKEGEKEKYPAVISVERLDDYNGGQLAYFLLLSQAIKKNL